MNEAIIELIKLGGGAAMLVGLVAWLGKILIEKIAQRDTERFIQRLQHEHEQALERFRSEASVSAAEHEIRYRNVFERQALVMARVYKLLEESHQGLRRLFAMIEYEGDPTKEDRFKQFHKSFQEFYRYYRGRKLFLPGPLSQRIDYLSQEVWKEARQFWRCHSREAKGQPSGQDDYWEKAEERLRDEFVPLLEKIESDFRKLLGIQATVETSPPVSRELPQPHSS
ncbi:MAG: hypothetical protein H7Y88_07450 [Phycisphaerales bacterium]|nr:hypothetical protein [Phycisphaerales bacterium]